MASSTNKVGSLAKRSTTPSPAPNPMQAPINRLSPEIILQIFYALIDFSRGDPASMFALAISSRRFYSVFKDSELALFRRLVISLLGCQEEPEFYAQVIKFAYVRHQRPWPVKPDNVDGVLALHGLMSTSKSTSPTRLSDMIHPSMFSDIIAWICLRMPFAVEEAYTRRRLVDTWIRKRSLEFDSFAMNHMFRQPFDCLFVHGLFGPHRVDGYLRELTTEADLYRRHLKLPWKKREDCLKFYDEAECYQMGDDCRTVLEFQAIHHLTMMISPTGLVSMSDEDGGGIHGSG